MPGADSVAGTGDPTAAAAPLPDSRTTAAAAGASDSTSTQAIQTETRRFTATSELVVAANMDEGVIAGKA